MPTLRWLGMYCPQEELCYVARSMQYHALLLACEYVIRKTLRQVGMSHGMSGWQTTHGTIDHCGELQQNAPHYWIRGTLRLLICHSTHDHAGCYGIDHGGRSVCCSLLSTPSGMAPAGSSRFS